MFELTEIMRQKDDAPFAEILNSIREGRQTEKDISVLTSRSVSSKTVDYQGLRNKLHLFPCNAAVDAHYKDIYEIATSQIAEIMCEQASDKVSFPRVHWSSQDCLVLAPFWNTVTDRNPKIR